MLEGCSKEDARASQYYFKGVEKEISKLYKNAFPQSYTGVSTKFWGNCQTPHQLANPTQL